VCGGADGARVRRLTTQIPEYCRVADEEEIRAHAYELVFAFDELVTLGYNDNLTISQVGQGMVATGPGVVQALTWLGLARAGAHVHRDGQPRGADPRNDCTRTSPPHPPTHPRVVRPSRPHPQGHSDTCTPTLVSTHIDYTPAARETD
jgi:hypothetical protein